MKTTDILSFLSLTLLAYAHAIPDPASPVTVPEATPDCSGALTVPSASEIAKAVAGCHGISANGGVRNDIIDGTCKPVTLIFARGTGEKGNIGQIVGPPFVVALEKEFGKGNVAVQGVNDYPAVVHDYCAGGEMLRKHDRYTSSDILTHLFYGQEALAAVNILLGFVLTNL